MSCSLDVAKIRIGVTHTHTRREPGGPKILYVFWGEGKGNNLKYARICISICMKSEEYCHLRNEKKIHFSLLPKIYSDPGGPTQTPINWKQMAHSRG
jgi:hypothetical protein